MKRWPKTLAGRTFLLVFVSVALAQAATFAVVTYTRYTFLVDQGVELITSHVRLARYVIETAPIDRRAQLVGEVIGDRSIRVVSRTTPPEERVRHRFPFLDRLTRQLRDALGPDTSISMSRMAGGLAFWVGFRAAGESWWLVVPATHVDRPLPWPLVAFLGFVLALVLALAWKFVRSVARPVRELEAAAHALGTGTPKPVRPRGPREIRNLGEAFNAMLAKLEESDRTRRTMLAGLPHDLRAPLTRLRLRLSMLGDHEAREGLARDAADIERIANAFIDYLRGLDATTLARERVDLGLIAAERIARYVDAGQRVELQADTAAIVLGAGESLGRLLDNLIDNALRHGAAPVEVRVQKRADRVVLEVRDHGPGIPAADRERALQPFVQLDAARGTRGTTGLGLAIVERIAVAHGARLELADAEGGGLRVVVSFRVPELQSASELPA